MSLNGLNPFNRQSFAYRLSPFYSIHFGIKLSDSSGLSPWS